MLRSIGNPSCFVVIRTAGERTFEACKSLVLKQIPEDHLHIVNERPFEVALRRCYQIGLESNAKWMITLDADVLLRENAIAGLLSEAEAMPTDHFQIEGMVLDKLTHRFRWAGYRCYRVKYLQAALSLLPADRAEIRPESTTLEKMMVQGYPFLRSNQVYGIHDFEQNYRDVYRKTYVHADKHQIWLPEILATWKRLAREDADFRIALRGAYDGLLATESPRIDTRDYSEPAERAMTDLGLTEKNELLGECCGFPKVEALINKAVNSPGVPRLGTYSTRSQRLSDRYQRLGPWRIGPYLIGALLCDVGNIFKRMAEGKSDS